MTECPILFSGPMVRAILAGAKTQTRRAVKPQPVDGPEPRWTWCAASTDQRVVGAFFHGVLDPRGTTFADRGPERRTMFRCPFGAPGDVLWVRETWRADDFDDARTLYAADMPEDALVAGRGVVRWHPSIHMPRGRSRLSLRVTSVRAERLHAITPADIVAEGVRVPVSPDGGALVRLTGAHPPAQFLDMRRPRSPEDYLRAEWASLWCEINGRASWDANPWVWVIGIERAEVSRG